MRQSRRHHLRGLGAVLAGAGACGAVSRALAAAGLQTVAAEMEPLPIVSSQGLPLKSYHIGSQPAGAAVEVAVAVAERAGFAPMISLMPWERVMRVGRSGEAVIAAMLHNVERERTFIFSHATFVDEVVVVTLAGREFPFAGVDDLRGRSCSRMTGAVFGEAFRLASPDIRLSTDTGPMSRLRRLEAGEVDCALFNPGAASVHAAIRDAGYDPARFTVLPQPLATVTNHMAIGRSPHGERIIGRLNPAIDALRADGTIDAIVGRNYR